MNHRAADITGLRVGYLTALEYHSSNGRRSLWRVRCDCGAELTLSASELKKQSSRGVIASCGCKRRETQSQRKLTHGMSKHPAFAVWSSMLARCTRASHPAWKNYGGRGITVCSRWVDSFASFWGDMGPSYQPGLTLDRKDNERGYSPDNCRWATYKEQAANTRSARGKVLTPLGLLTPKEIAHATGVPYSTVLYRLSRGVSGTELLEPPDVSRRFTTSSTAAPATAS